MLLFCLFYDEVVLKWLLARTFDRFHKCCDPKINVISWPPNSKYSSPFRHMGCLIKSLRPRIHVRFLFAHLLGQFCFNRELRFLCCSLLAMFCWVVEYIYSNKSPSLISFNSLFVVFDRSWFLNFLFMCFNIWIRVVNLILLHLLKRIWCSG